MVTNRTNESMILKQYVAERERVRALSSEIDRKDALINTLQLQLRKETVTHHGCN